MRITSGQELGQRPYQEDRFVVIEDIEKDRTLIAVFDGHSGSRAVDTLATSLPDVLRRYVDREPVDLIKTVYTYLDEKTKDIDSGSTASMALITPDKVVLAVLGDSPIQAILKDKEFTMPEHNVRTNYYETMEAQQRGGTIYGGYLFDPMKGYNKGIQMSRVFGDSDLRRVTSQIPEVSVLEREDVVSLLVASDGLTDPAHVTAPFLLTKDVTAEELVEKFKNSFDNVTAVVVHF
jgi:protein phosphatase 1L